LYKNIWKLNYNLKCKRRCGLERKKITQMN
jgi:hypothetical protein